MTTRNPAHLIVMCALLILTGLLGACSTGTEDDDADAGGSPTALMATASATDSDDADPTATGTAVEPTATDAAATPTEAQATATATEPGDDATPTEADGSTAGDAEIEAELRDVIADTAELRGLEPMEEVEIEIISREQLNSNMLQLLDRDYPPEEAAEDSRILYLLRLIEDPELDLHGLYVDLYSERALGYYDVKRNALFLVSDEEGLSGLAEMTMSHELVHALQDQHYDLEAIRSEELDADALTAAVALTEGDADNTSSRYALEYMERGEIADAVAESGALSSNAINAAPTYIREGLFFPYVQGVAFVNQILSDGGFARVDAAYADPPSSTEQILHPEKYLGERDDPQAVVLPDLSAALSDWSSVDSDTLGEFDLEVMLRENGVAESEDAAAGWDGGQWAYYTSEDGDHDLVIMGTLWDTEQDAQEFDAALRSALDAGGPATGEIWDDGNGRYTTLATTADGMRLYIASTDRAAVESAAAAVQ